MKARPRLPLFSAFALAPVFLFLQLPPTAPAEPFARPSETSALPLRVQLPARVRVPAGSLRAGSDDREMAFALGLCARDATPDLRSLCAAMLQLERTPPRRVRLSAFEMDRFEVSQAAYARCLQAGACTPDHGGPAAQRGDRLPQVAVDQAQAQAYCAFAGGSLPTEAEWERAARGAGSRRFPWGDVDNASLSNHGRLRAGAADGYVDRAEDEDDGYAGLAPVGSYPSGASPFGLEDMAGNAREWTLDALPANAAEEPWQSSVDPRGPAEGAVYVVRGGGYLSARFELRVSHRWAEAREHFAADLGFRCVYPR